MPAVPLLLYCYSCHVMSAVETRNCYRCRDIGSKIINSEGLPRCQQCRCCCTTIVAMMSAVRTAVVAMDVGSKVILIRKGCPDGALLLNANGQN